MKEYTISSERELLITVKALGFLPFFKNRISGFSIEEMCPPELWFADGVDGPWEWKGPVAKSGECIYGKFFKGKAGFVSREWLPDFANHRRDGYDFDSRYEEGLVFFKDRDIFEAVEKNGTILSKTLKEICGYRRGGSKGFDPIITRLQMQSYVCIADFAYAKDKTGKPYGWGIAEYTTPEAIFGYDAVTSAYKTEPKESMEKMISYLTDTLPNIDASDLDFIVG